MRLKTAIKRIALIILTCAGYVSGWYLLRKLVSEGAKQEVRILRYHSVSDSRGHETNVRIDAFRRQMSFVKQHYHPISLRAFVDNLVNRKRLPARSIVVSFDDGYRENFTHACPILEELGIPAVFFLLSDFVGTSKVLPHDTRDDSRCTIN